VSKVVHHDIFGYEIPLNETVLVSAPRIAFREITISYFTEKSCVQVKKYKTRKDKKIYHNPDSIIVMNDEQRERYQQKKFWSRLSK
jgi:hypothetical protein